MTCRFLAEAGKNSFMIFQLPFLYCSECGGLTFQTMQLQNGGESILLEGFSGDSVVKNLPVTQETWVRSLGWEDSLEEEMAAHL